MDQLGRPTRLVSHVSTGLPLVLALGLLLLYANLISDAPSPFAWVDSPSTFVACLAIAAVSARRRGWSSVVLGTAAAIVLYVAALSSCSVFAVMNWMASLTSRTAGHLIGKPLDLGPTPLGIPVLLLSLCVVLARQDMDRRARLCAIAWHAGWLVAFAHISALWMMWSLHRDTSGIWWPSLATMSDWNAANTYLTAGIGYCTIGHFILRSRKKAPEYSVAIICAIAGTAMVAFVWLWAPKVSAVPGKSTILIFDDQHLNLVRPDERHFGATRTGTFGVLPDYLREIGYDVRNGPITASNLSDVSVAILINPRRMFRPDEEESVRAFVRRGGSLLVLGDHTGDIIIRKPFNRLLRPMGIQFNFDTAEPLTYGWCDSLRMCRHPLRRSWRGDPGETGIWVGASLTTNYPAYPLIWGKQGFADQGDLGNKDQGYLGNRRFDFGERLGDIVLAAEAKYGAGKVIVFGDTSGLQNSSFLYDDAFTRAMFEYLSGTKSHSPRHCALIDASHWEFFCPDEWGPNGVGGLGNVLLRVGLVPKVTWRWPDPELRTASLLVIVAPRARFTHSDTNDVERFLKRGGTVILATGLSDGRAGRELLSHFGIHLSQCPLGRCRTKCLTSGFNGSVDFTCAWELRRCVSDKVIAAPWGKPSILLRSIGRGKLIVIGDSKFLLNDNLEGLDAYSPNNTRFVESLIGGSVR